MDWGKDHYAVVTWSNAPEGRHIALAWMSNWEYANNVPTLAISEWQFCAPRSFCFIPMREKLT